MIFIFSAFLLWFKLFQFVGFYKRLASVSVSSRGRFSFSVWCLLVVWSLTGPCLIAPTGRHLSEQSKQAQHPRPQTGPGPGGQNTEMGNSILEKKIPQGNFRICNKIEHELIYVTGLKWPLLQSQRWRSLLKSSVIFPKFDQVRAENYNISQPEQNPIQTIQKILNIQ